MSTWAPSRFAANSKERRVRVEGSKKMDYKARFLPQQRLMPEGWTRVER